MTDLTCADHQHMGRADNQYISRSKGLIHKHKTVLCFDERHNNKTKQSASVNRRELDAIFLITKLEAYIKHNKVQSLPDGQWN